jgi:hypothetical protein
MASVLRRIAQNPSRTFIVTQNEGSGERGAYYFLPETVEAWISSNSADMNVVGKSIVITGNFTTVMQSLSEGNPSSYSRFQERLNLVDLGTQYVIGNPVNSRMIVLRRVRGPGLIENGGLNGIVAYICVENNCSDSPALRFLPRVARI